MIVVIEDIDSGLGLGTNSKKGGAAPHSLAISSKSISYFAVTTSQLGSYISGCIIGQ